MSKQSLKERFGWGFLLWFIGYVLGFIFFMFVPQSLVGWFVMPIGIIITAWVLMKKINAGSLRYYFSIGITWAIIAVICDYVFLVLLLKPADGYYKLDVYLYYILTFVLPVMIGWWKRRRQTLPPLAP